MNSRKIFLIVQSALCLLVAALLIAAVIGIYREGLIEKAENPLSWIFSEEKAAERFRLVAPPLYAAVGLAAVGLLLGVRDESRPKPGKTGRVAHKRFPAAKTLRIVLLLTAACMIAAGLRNGSARDVFGKAVKICTECVGLG